MCPAPAEAERMSTRVPVLWGKGISLRGAYLAGAVEGAVVVVAVVVVAGLRLGIRGELVSMGSRAQKAAGSATSKGLRTKAYLRSPRSETMVLARSLVDKGSPSGT